jgi:hypothetical protein
MEEQRQNRWIAGPSSLDRRTADTATEAYHEAAEESNNDYDGAVVVVVAVVAWPTSIVRAVAAVTIAVAVTALTTRKILITISKN